MAIHVAVLASAPLIACFAPEDERITCDDLLEPEDVSYVDLEALVMTDGGKGCANTSCHGEDVEEKGLRLDERGVVYDALTIQVDKMYGQIASGAMPEDGGQPRS